MIPYSIFLPLKNREIKKILKLAFVLRAFSKYEYLNSFQDFTELGKEDKAEGKKFNGRPPLKPGP